MKGGKIMLLQKICGVLISVLGWYSAYATSDGTAAVMIIPWGLWLIFSREQMMMFNYSQKRIARHKKHAPEQSRKSA